MLDTTLTSIDYYIHLYLLPAIIVSGVIGNLSNIYIFTRPSLYRSCSIYFLAGAVNGLIILLFGTTTRWLGYSFPRLDATEFSLFFCRFRSYLINIIYDLAPYFIACVTVDRFCSSSTNVNVRRWSSRPKIAYAVICIIILLTFVAFIHIPIYFTIIDSLCQTEPDFYTRFFPFFATIYYFTAVFIIIIFGLSTAYNVRAQRRRIQSITIRANQSDRKNLRSDGQILLILLVHVACYAVFSMPYYITLIVAVVRPSVVNDSLFLFIQRMAIIALNFSQAVSKDLIQIERKVGILNN
jgi:hypothetical protein